jgi:hypothetical protein
MSAMFYLLVATDLIPTISLSKSASAAHFKARPAAARRRAMVASQANLPFARMIEVRAPWK